MIIEEFLREYDASAATLKAYREALKNFEYFLAGVSITDAKEADIVRYKRELMQVHKPATTNLYLSAVRCFYKWCEKLGYCADVAKDISNVRKHHSNVAARAFTSKQVSEILGSIDTSTTVGRRNRVMLVTMFSTALRCVEVSRLNRDDLVCITGQWCLLVQGKGDADADAVVTIPASLAAELQSYLAERTDSGDALFASYSHRRDDASRLSPQSISRICKNIFRGAGYDLSTLTAHSTRHTAITVALENGADIREVQQFARHSSINTTLIYDHSLKQLENCCSSILLEQYSSQLPQLECEVN